VVARVCAKLDLADTRVTLSAGQKARLAPAHTAEGLPVPNWDFDTLAGAGALRSTVNDLLDFLEANLGRSQSPLGATLASCHAPRVGASDGIPEVGLAWHLSPVGEGPEKLVWHNGATGGHSSFIGFVRERQIGVVVLSNSAAPVDDIALDLVRKLLE
jgi:CubicO group peptidase (beta-lactamase class C family)